MRALTARALALLLCGAPALAVAAPVAHSGADSARALPSRVFAEDSFWYRTLPADTPVAADSAQVVADLVRQAEEHFGSPGRPAVNINTSQYTPPIHVADAQDPLVDVAYVNCQGKRSDDLYVHRLFLDPGAPMQQVRIPAEAQPALGSDQEMVVYDPTSDAVIETWKTERRWDGSLRACWGGVLRPAGESDGVFEAPYGVAASGLSLLGGTMTAAELSAGKVEHVVGIALPYTAPPPTTAGPATRTDGVNPQGLAVPAQGQLLRLPADLDLEELKLSPIARIVAQAAQDHGLVVWDTAGAVSLRAQGESSVPEGFYRELLRGRGAAAEMAGDPARQEDPFPLDRLELLPADYEVPLTAPDAPQEPAPQEEQAARALPTGALILVVGLGALALGALGLALRSPKR